jgi:ribosome-binding factor A
MFCYGTIRWVKPSRIDEEDQMPSPLRMKRINDRIKEVLSVILLAKIEDPRLTDVIVTDVRVDRELDYANIYVSAPQGRVREKEVLAALNHAAGFLKYELANEVELRIMPKLRFFWDVTPERADRIDTLLAQLRDEQEVDEETPENLNDEDEANGSTD